MATVRHLLFLTAMVCSLTGCDFLHNLQPHRLHRLNRGPASSSGSNPYFSVPDPLPVDADEVQDRMSQLPIRRASSTSWSAP
jgi:hypothetical protein